MSACTPTRQETNFSANAQHADANVTKTAVLQPSPTPLPTNTPTQTVMAEPTTTPSPTNTPLPTATATVSFPQSDPVQAGVKLPVASQAIQANNFQQLTHVAQWGKGELLGVAFSPVDNLFIVGSSMGTAVYDQQNPDTPPQWIPFAQPYFYESISFSEDGHYLKLENRENSKVYRFADGQLATDISELTWIHASKQIPYNNRSVLSDDKSRQFKSYSTYEEDNMTVELIVHEMIDHDTGELLYQFEEETMYVQFEDYHQAEGCDLYTFSMCGNVYDPSAMHPYRAAFSSTTESIAILYRAPNMWNSHQFSVLKLFRVSDGYPLNHIGDFTRPVETFSYAPDGQSILVGYVDGSIELWDIQQNTLVFSAKDFAAPIVDLDYSYDGQYLVVQRPDMVEIRTTENGGLQNEYAANAFTLSPIANQVVLGHSDGEINVIDMVDDQTLYSINGHDGEIFALAFAPDGHEFSSSGGDCRVQSWEAQTGNYVRDYAEHVTDAYGMGTESRIFIQNMSYVPDTDQLIGRGSWSRVVSWQTTTGDSQYLIEPEPLEYYQGMITLNPHFPEFFGFNQENQSLLIDRAEYDLTSGELIGAYKPAQPLAEGCAQVGPVTADGKLMFTRGYDEHEGQVCILSAEDLQLIRIMELGDHLANKYEAIHWLYLSPDGKQLIITMTSGVIHVFQLKNPALSMGSQSLKN